jgi:site-specific DNA-cytosine methylase
MIELPQTPTLPIHGVMPRFSSILSLFDGMSCGQIALNRVGIEYDNYFASEIDNYAIKVTQANYPKTIQLGDVCGIQYEDGALFHHQNDNPLKNGGSFITKIDLLIGGSPCQGFSFAGKGLNFEDQRSKLFFEFVRLKNEIKPKYFLLENVVMKKEHEKVISEFLGVEPILINSNLVSGQNRKRLYWTNIPGVKQPTDKHIGWGEIKESGVADNFYYSENGLSWIKRHGERKGKKLAIWGENDKCQMIEASHFKNYSSQRFFGIEDEKGLRYITPVECERAQTVPDNYTQCVSNTQRYKMLGNGWTVDVISHIFGSLLNGA